jgi:hypothetical protein
MQGIARNCTHLHVITYCHSNFFYIYCVQLRNKMVGGRGSTTIVKSAAGFDVVELGDDFSDGLNGGGFVEGGFWILEGRLELGHEFAEVLEGFLRGLKGDG